jgi:hypothetical protein
MKVIVGAHVPTPHGRFAADNTGPCEQIYKCSTLLWRWRPHDIKDRNHDSRLRSDISYSSHQTESAQLAPATPRTLSALRQSFTLSRRSVAPTVLLLFTRAEGMFSSLSNAWHIETSHCSGCAYELRKVVFRLAQNASDVNILDLCSYQPASIMAYTKKNEAPDNI